MNIFLLMKIQSFTDLTVWQKGYEFVIDLYKITNNFPQSEQFSLTNQMRRAAVSIASNIAEGFGRESYKEKNQFYNIARGSLIEVQNQLLISKGLEYLSDEESQELMKKSVIVHKLLNALILKKIRLSFSF